jgi:hypothetical protein
MLTARNRRSTSSQCALPAASGRPLTFASDRPERPLRRFDQQQMFKHRLKHGIRQGDTRECGARRGDSFIDGE